MSPTDAELAAIRADAEAVAAAKADLVGKGHTHDAERWQVDWFTRHLTNDVLLYYVSNEDEDGSNRYDHFECPPEEYCRLLCEYRNRPLDGHVLALLSEVERLKGQGDKFEAMVFDLQDRRSTLERELVRCRTEKQELIRRLEGLMDDWYDRRNEARREAGPGPCTEASTLEDCAEELGAALDEAEGKITP